jgi:prepilin-type N-terminal cleavage/methylation domain-containing protein/prepilin-type processing-associated H-X9-DG protein
MKRRSAFTLIELLVVVAIIAVLIAILLPSLNKSREQARIAKCAVNERAIAMGCVVYAQDNSGTNIIEFVKSGSPDFPNGFWWTNELVSQGYVKAPNNFQDLGGGNFVMTMDRSANSIFYCPDSLLDTQPSGVTWTQNFPRDRGNLAPNHQATPKVAGPGNTRIYNWYGLTSTITKNNDMSANPNGTATAGATAFIDYSGNTGTPPATEDPRYQRSSRLIAAPSRMVMVMEAPSDDNFPAATPQSKAPVLRGIHGDATNNGLDGTTNFAFFDGHVAKYPTSPYSQNGFATNLNSSTGIVGATVQDTIFFLQQQ